MRPLILVALLCSGAPSAQAMSTPRQDALVASYFAIWDSDGGVTPDNVAKLYAPHVIYYGHPMTRESLYRDKLDFIRRWPGRRYGVEPGSSAEVCDDGKTHCVLTATLVWRTSGAGGTRTGRSRIRLTLSQADGGLKIVREGAVTLNRSRPAAALD